MKDRTKRIIAAAIAIFIVLSMIMSMAIYVIYANY